MPAPAPVSIPVLGCSDLAIMQTICSLGLMITAFDVDAEFINTFMSVRAPIIPDRQQCASYTTHNRHSNMLGAAMEVKGSCNDECCNLHNKKLSVVATLPKSKMAVDCGVLHMLCICRVASVEERQTKWAVRWRVLLQRMWYSGKAAWPGHG